MVKIEGIELALKTRDKDIGNIDKSFQYYQIGNKINRSNINFNIKEEKRYFNEIKTSELYAKAMVSIKNKPKNEINKFDISNEMLLYDKTCS